MRVAITYPPVKSKKGIPLLSQNRQFQYFKEPTYIYPVVPAYAATLLKQDGFEVLWKDCIAENISENDFFSFLKEQSPDLIATETKTPVVKKHWQIIDRIKQQFPHIKTLMFGDHVTALPEESMNNSKVDYILTGGDYDFLLLNLCRAIKNMDSFGSLEPGIYFRHEGQIRNTGKFILNHKLDDLPFVDRELTNWKSYAYKNGNFRQTPGTYIMAGRDCWWAKCKFCSWPTLYPEFRVRSPDNVLDEIGILIETFKVREIMDDTGTFPVGDWLKEFCNGMIERGYNKKIKLDCNMRFGALNLEEYKLMKDAGFRLVLFGLESANQNTLDRIDKNIKTQDIVNSCKMAKSAGLFPHITIMFGYPWESYDDALKTLNLGRWLLRKGFAHTVQATIVIPYPGSKLFQECKVNNNLLTENWDDYDMKKPVMKIPYDEEKMSRLVQGIYSVVYNPEFIFRRLAQIKDRYDFLYSIRGFNKAVSHIFDFRS